ncbi:MAG: CopG family transcriptional regulator [Alphaproteobacteria bacterium]|nr:CopG family transcriptional regulator [Alphaproteobacteria bacterium]MDE2494882.1 CopG family transcriptional regulator [Alphaproteobacteria bacterium]
MPTRTTLTLDDDVAVQLERLRRERDASLKDVVNDLLRQKLHELRALPKPRKPFVTRAVNLGEPLLSLDNIGEVLEFLDENDYIKKKLYPRDPG